MGMIAGTQSGLVDVATGAVVAFGGRDVGALDGDWVVLDGAEVRRRSVNGAGPVVPDGDRITCVAGRSDGSAVAGTTGAHLLAVGSSLERVDAFEAAAGRGSWYTPWGAPPDVRTIAVSPAGTVLVNVHVGGIVRSTDGGVSWEPTIDVHADVHQVLALGGGAAVAACAVGLATSDDDGATWTVHDDGLHATYARSVAVAGDTVLLGVSTGPGGSEAAVYRRPISGGPLVRCTGGLPGDLGGNVDTGRLAAAADGTAAVATSAGDVFVSTDEGTTWDRAASGLSGVRFLAFD